MSLSLDQLEAEAEGKLSISTSEKERIRLTILAKLRKALNLLYTLETTEASPKT